MKYLVWIISFIIGFILVNKFINPLIFKSGSEINAGYKTKKGYTWEKAMKYCDGTLPTVAQLEKIGRKECTRGKTSKICKGRYWSSEASGKDSPFAKTVWFLNGRVAAFKKILPYDVLCAQ